MKYKRSVNKVVDVRNMKFETKWTKQLSLSIEQRSTQDKNYDSYTRNLERDTLKKGSLNLNSISGGPS